ncbi:MAG: diguanylate cyclase [Acidobacteria bacterium]|nr:diguanylate cyclase [Acidobacteriota bacterium]
MTWWAMAALAFLTASVTGWLTVTMTRAVRAARHHRAVATAALADVDALLMAAIDLRGVDEVADAGNKICRIATELLRGDGAVLDRIGAVDSLFDAATRDPVSGVANRLHASTLIASLRPGDGLLLIEIDGLDEARRTGGVDAANVLLGQAGLHLRHGIRAGDAVARFADNQFVVVLRSLKIPIERVGTRLLDTWRHGQAGRTISVGAALHLDGDMPLDTLDRADSAVISARSRGDEVHVASVWARPAPSPAGLRTPAA